ncbi:MAG TPA: shikimate kinase [Gaiellaceae bacterium]|nr:shikimate kinase [Gaiellaceae bacterium]
MGAGKSTLGEKAARLSGRLFVDLDREIERRHAPVAELFERGEPEFRRLEEELAAEVLSSPEPAVIALGGGAVLSERTRDLLRSRAYTVRVEVDPAAAWERVRRSDRPLARDEEAFRALFDERQPLYDQVSATSVRSVDDVLLAALEIEVARGRLAGLDVAGPVAVIADEHVLGLHPLGFRPNQVHAVPRGEAAKTTSVLAQLWADLDLDRTGTIVGYGGGSTTDVAGLAAATYLRGVRWLALPTTLLGQVDAAIGGKTAIDLAAGKNLVGAFHYPAGVVVDPDVLATLSETQRRDGMAEVVKTGLLAGRPLWELGEDELIRGAAAFKAGICLGDPFDRGRRAILNLGHTFAHALEAAAGYDGLSHGSAVALGLLAALRLSGRSTDVVEELLAPRPVPVDRDRAWAALQRDKKSERGELRLVLLNEDGPVVATRPEAEVRTALNELIAD